MSKAPKSGFFNFYSETKFFLNMEFVTFAHLCCPNLMQEVRKTKTFLTYPKAERENKNGQVDEQLLITLSRNP